MKSTEQKGKRGRPPKPNRKSQAILIRMTQDLYDTLVTQAEAKALDVSSYARSLIADGLKANAKEKGAAET